MAHLVTLNTLALTRLEQVLAARQKIYDLVRAMGAPEPTAARMSGLGSEIGRWLYTAKAQATLQISAVMETHHAALEFRFALSEALSEAGWASAPATAMELRDGAGFKLVYRLAEPARLDAALHRLHDIATHQTREELFERLSERNSDLAKATEAAENAAQTKSDFLANMSHEIRTPMNAIMGLTHLALRGELADKQRDYLEKIQQSAQHLLGIINDILDFSKIEARKLTVEAVEFELEKVLENVSTLVYEKCMAKGLSLSFDVAPDVPARLIGDPLRLGQVLINYANNAVKFTESGGITLSVQRSADTGDGLELYFAVTDTGIGLTPEQCARLFQSFQQADGSTTRRFGGTGLGLAISKSLAELMGGAVGVTSEPGHGSTFWCTVRLQEAASGARARVLVVDDETSLGTLVRLILEPHGYDVVAVESGAAALEVLIEAPFDLVLLDWQMPGMDGLELARRVRAMQLLAQPRLVMLTGFGDASIGVQATAAGIDRLMLKPFNPQVLLEEVGTISRVPSGAAPKAPGASKEDDREALRKIAGARILLVEDNELNQEVALGLMEEGGFVIDVAGNGQLAVERVLVGNYDIVLMDLQMPVLDGLSATVKLRAIPAFAELPIVAMTANAMAGDRERCLEAGMNDHVAKPLEPAALWRALLNWIKPREGLGMPAPAAPVAAPAPAGAGSVLPDQIPGLDLVDGLRRTLGKETLYRSLLRKFVTTQGGFGADLSAALAAGDYTTAERYAHTLKGVCGNLGAPGLGVLAGELEKSLGAHDDLASISPKLEIVTQQLAELLAAISAALPPDEQAVAAEAVDWEALRPLIAQLRALLEDSDAEALELLEANGKALHAAFGPAYRKIEKCVRDFDFEAGLEALNAAAAARAG